MRIDLSCSQCGNNRFALTDAETDASVVQCEDCGHEVGTLGQLKEAVADAVLRNSGQFLG